MQELDDLLDIVDKHGRAQKQYAADTLDAAQRVVYGQKLFDVSQIPDKGTLLKRAEKMVSDVNC